MSRVGSIFGFIAPQLPTLSEQPGGGLDSRNQARRLPHSPRYRAQQGAGLYPEWFSDRYPRIIDAAVKLRCRSAVLDGEVVVQDERGVSDFEALQQAIKSDPGRLIFYAFDLLRLDGRDIRGLPLIERRARLKKLIGADPTNRLQFSDEYVGNAAALFRACAQHELEGIVSKRADSSYRSGRSTTWLKTKCFTEGGSRLLGSTATARRAPNERFSQNQSVGDSFMPVLLLSRFAAMHVKNSRPNSLRLFRSDQRFPGSKIEMRAGSVPSSP